MNDKQYWQDTFEKTAFRCSTSARSSFFSDANTRVLHNEVRRLVGRPKGKTIMDVGCGDGSLLKHLAGDNRVIGLDSSQGMLKHAAASGLEPLRADFDHIPMQKDSCDIIVSVEAITLSDDPYSCVEQFMNLIVPGGSLVLSVLNSCSLIRRLVSPFFHLFVKQLPTPLDPAKVCRIIRQKNGEVISTSTTVMLPGKSLIRPLKTGSTAMYLGNNFIIKAEKH